MIYDEIMEVCGFFLTLEEKIIEIRCPSGLQMAPDDMGFSLSY